VVDNGVGITKKTQESLMYLFKGPHDDVRHGVGIGLSSARAITDALGGTIRVKSKKNDGTTITFTTLVHAKELRIDQ